ncbi:hypothetical protein CERZMDRAFT_113850 [Cercospora zeae-maydis SCOH1-5]|uniref:Cytochrome b561 domain-containing protein n=1 Tax=Cercospora zeae-maydis SCOH1-5 TaxID=717836 RepID=A0A6A6F813_9PEZI|nr:hypothetical protein CERZMDRAFT_113850 [Cercospora zeae-maydis SCOH1-5]
MKNSVAKAAVLAMMQGSMAYAQVARTCPTSDSNVCYSLNVPAVTASSNTGDIFFRIEAPATSYEWVALGQGSQMAGGHIFVLYPNAAGTNVTISPRLGVGHVEPQFNAVNMELLEGSGIANGVMTANIRCGGCNTWDGGSMDFTQSSTTWLYAVKNGSPIQDDSQSAAITQHDDHGAFSWDITSAKGGSSVNPFIAQAATSTTQTSTTSVSSGPSKSYIIAHAVFACLSVAFLLPIGGIVIRVGGFSKAVLVHQIIQWFGLIMYIIAFGLGAYYAKSNKLWNNTHPIIGSVIFGLMLSQPIFGIIHHQVFKRIGGRSVASWFHLTIGRSIIILGIINGGLGLKLATQSRGAKIGYGVGAGIMGLAYLLAVVFGETKRSKNRTRKSSSDGSSASQELEK